MNPQGVYNNTGGNPPSYNLEEIWPFNGGAAGVCAPSIHAADDLAASINRKMNMSLNVNLEIPNHIDNRVRRRQDEDACGASTSREVNMNDSISKRIKAASDLNENSKLKEEGEEKKTKVVEQMAKTVEPPSKQDYIHVRARRGQATDNHSLAERARREKISEKMKTLQDLVPGCNKVIGKAVVLDEIINYVQSLQRQVEFLSMKLEAVNSGQSAGIEGFPLKDVFGQQQQQFDSSGMPFDPHSSRNYSRGASPEWLHMQIGGGFDINRDTR